MFLSSLGVSWLYNSFLSSLDKESIQRRILFEDVLAGPKVYKYILKTRTAMTVFVLLVLASSRETPELRAEQTPLQHLLNDLLPNDTEIWSAWKHDLLDKIREHIDPLTDISFDSPALP